MVAGRNLFRRSIPIGNERCTKPQGMGGQEGASLLSQLGLHQDHQPDCPGDGIEPYHQF